MEEQKNPSQLPLESKASQRPTGEQAKAWGGAILHLPVRLILRAPLPESGNPWKYIVVSMFFF
jgi:hypothetical protein